MFKALFQVDVVLSLIFIKFYSIKWILYWSIVLFFIIKLYGERKYYILTTYFCNERKILYKESINYQKKFQNIDVSNIRLLRILHKTLSRPWSSFTVLMTIWTIVEKRMRLKKGLPRLTSSKVEVRSFLATLQQLMQSYSSCISHCQHNFEKGKHLENNLK